MYTRSPPRDWVKLKGHRSKIDRDFLRLPKKVVAQVSIEPFAFRAPLGLKDRGRLKRDEFSAKSQDYFWNGSSIDFLASALPRIV